MYSDVINVQKGALAPLFVTTSQAIDATKLSLYIFENGEFSKSEAQFREAGHLLYKTSLRFDDAGYYQAKVSDGDSLEFYALLHVTDTLQTLIDAQMGNWEITNNQMIFYRVDGSELMRFDLYDKDGNKTSFGVVKRVRV